MNNFIEKQAVSIMPVNHVQSLVCVVTVLVDVGSSTSNRMLTAVDLTATGVTVNKHFVNVAYGPFKIEVFYCSVS